MFLQGFLFHDCGDRGAFFLDPMSSIHRPEKVRIKAAKVTPVCAV